MKYIASLLFVAIFIATSCVPTFENVGELPNDPSIIEILIGNENGNLPFVNAIYSDNHLDTVFVKDKTVDFSKVYLQGNLSAGCKIEPIDGAPIFGTYGDFSSARKYKVIAPSGNSAEWTIVLDYYIPPVGCLADRWVGNLTCFDGIWADSSPTSGVGRKMNDDCHLVKLTFDFWGDVSAMAIMNLQLGEIDMDTFSGEVTLLEDVAVDYYGDVYTFHKGSAGTYSATANELYLNFEFSGYDIGGDGRYRFTVSQN